MPKSIRQLTKKILHSPDEISLSISKPAEGIDHKIYLCYDTQKVKIISHVLSENKDYDSIIIFSSTKSKVTEIVRSLNKSGFPAQGISSNLDQEKREEVLRGFRSKQIRILVATDVMSRGIDVKEINMVVNFDVPNDAEDYVHRVGRTARVNTKGEAITLVNEKDMYLMRKIEHLIEYSIPKYQPPSKIGAGPEWKDGNQKSRKKKSFHNKKRNFKTGNRNNIS